MVETQDEAVPGIVRSSICDRADVSCFQQVRGLDATECTHCAIAAENGEAEPCLIRAGLCLRRASRALGLESERRVFVVVLSSSSEGLRFDAEQDKELSRHIVMLGDPSHVHIAGGRRAFRRFDDE